MRILLIHNFYRLHGGEDSLVNNQIKLLQQTSTPFATFTFSSQNISSPIKTAFHLFYPNSKIITQLNHQIRQFKPDIVHLHNIYPLITPFIYQTIRFHHLPIVQTIHNYHFLSPKLNLGERK